MEPMREKIENAVAKSHDLPEPRKYRITEKKMQGVGRTGTLFEENYEGSSREDVVNVVKEIENDAGKYGICVIFQKMGWWCGKVKTETVRYEVENSGWFHPDNSWYESGTKRTVVKRHSYEIRGYKSLNLIDSIGGLADVSKVGEAIGGKTAEAALSILDELHYQYNPPLLLYSAITDSLSEKIVEARKKKTLKTIELFGLNREETYIEMEKLANDALVEELGEIAIRTNGKLLGSWRANREVGKAKGRHKETIGKVKTIKNQFIKPA